MLPLTLVYRRLADGSPVHLDVYPTTPDTRLGARCPVLVYFHGGGMTAGGRKSWLPVWLQQRAARSGIVFVSADYGLMPPATGYDVIDDIKLLFRFVVEDLPARLGDTCPVDPTRLAVAGSSSGGLCAYLAALHAQVPLCCLLAIYAMGGNLLDMHYVTVKKEPFFRGYEMLSPHSFQQFLHPVSAHLPPTSDSPPTYHSPDSTTPGYPSNPRMQLARLYIQEGVYLDYYTGQHDPSLSEALRSSFICGEDAALLLRCHRDLFPELSVDSAFPPTYLIHGSVDTAVRVVESRALFTALKSRGCDATLEEVAGAEHSFDYEQGAEEEHRELFNRSLAFLLSHLQPIPQ